MYERESARAKRGRKLKYGKQRERCRNEKKHTGKRLRKRARVVRGETITLRYDRLF